MIGRRDWLRQTTRGLGAWALAAGPLLEETMGQTPPKPGSTTQRRTVRRPALPDQRRAGIAAPGVGAARIQADEQLAQRLEPIRSQNHLPGIIGAVIKGDRLTAIAAAGVRKLGSSEPIRVQDQVHLGSCTKAMTATLIGMLIDDGLLTWQTTIRNAFPDVASRLDPGFQTVTLSQLLTHRAGLPHDASWWKLPGLTTTDQRRAALMELMTRPPQSKPGTRFDYSNAGYVVAGLMAEESTGQSWETLMQERLFDPLGMASAGFGPPGKRGAGRVDQPWGHHLNHGKLEPIWHDNPPCMGPAGTIHCSVPDWARFITLHMGTNASRSRLLKPATLTALQTPPSGESYAAGWCTVARPWAGGVALNHNGSNTYWYVSVWIARPRNFATLAAINLGGPTAEAACETITQELIQYAMLT